MEFTTLQRKMFEELSSKEIFDQAVAFSYHYLDTVNSRNVFPTEDALNALQDFHEPLQQNGSKASEVLERLSKYGSPSTVAQTGGRYFGLVNGGVIPASLAAKWLNDVWDQNTPLYATSPLVSHLEEVVEQWLLDLLGLPKESVAGFVSGSSMAILCGLAAARHSIYHRQGWNVNEKGLNGAPRIRIVTGRHTHATVLKAISLLGIGTHQVEWVDVDEQGRIIEGLLPKLDSSTILVLQAGNVNSGSFDPFVELCSKAREAGAWIHIDGAFGLWAAACPSLAHLTKGIELADSWSVDGHKTLNTPYDSGIILCRDKSALVSALQATGSYIIYGENRDGMLFTPEMSRRARAVEMWAALKYLGKEGVGQLILGLHDNAVYFADLLRQHGFEIVNEVVFNQILVGFENDQLTEEMIRQIQEDRVCWVGGATWFGKRVIRISVCSWVTTKEDIEMSVRSFLRARDLVKSR